MYYKKNKNWKRGVIEADHEQEKKNNNNMEFKQHAYCTIRAKHSALLRESKKSDIANVKNEKNDQMPSVEL